MLLADFGPHACRWGVVNLGTSGILGWALSCWNVEPQGLGHHWGQICLGCLGTSFWRSRTLIHGAHCQTCLICIKNRLFLLPQMHISLVCVESTTHLRYVPQFGFCTSQNSQFYSFEDFRRSSSLDWPLPLPKQIIRLILKSGRILWVSY